MDSLDDFLSQKEQYELLYLFFWLKMFSLGLPPFLRSTQIYTTLPNGMRLRFSPQHSSTSTTPLHSGRSMYLVGL